MITQTLETLLATDAWWRKELTAREQTFVENFTMTVDLRDPHWWWKQNLDQDLASYRYKNTAKIRRIVRWIMAELGGG